MKTQKWNVTEGGWMARSALECGGNQSAPPLLDSGRADEKRSRRFTLSAQSKFASLLALFLSVLSSQLATAFAQSYAIEWHTIDSGGGTSTGGVYSVSGTIGQPDAGVPMTNGQYAVTGGFWALPTAVQTPGAPTLTIVPAPPGNATISWSLTPTGFVLQESLSLSPLAWTNSLSGATNPIVVPTTMPIKFYRLFKL